MPESPVKIEVKLSLWGYWLTIVGALLVGWFLGSSGDILSPYLWELLHPENTPVETYTPT